MDEVFEFKDEVGDGEFAGLGFDRDGEFGSFIVEVGVGIDFLVSHELTMSVGFYLFNWPGRLKG